MITERDAKKAKERNKEGKPRNTSGVENLSTSDIFIVKEEGEGKKDVLRHLSLPELNSMNKHVPISL